MFRTFARGLRASLSLNREVTLASVNDQFRIVESELNQANPCARVELDEDLLVVAGPLVVLPFKTLGATCFDQFKWWSNTTNRWISKETQVFSVSLKVRQTGVAGPYVIRRNGVVFAEILPGFAGTEIFISCLIPMNGFTDYIDFAFTPLGGATISKGFSYATIHAVGRLSNG